MSEVVKVKGQLTHWLNPNAAASVMVGPDRTKRKLVLSEFGDVTNGQWLRKRKMLNNKVGFRCYIADHPHGNGEKALVRVLG